MATKRVLAFQIARAMEEEPPALRDDVYERC